MVMGEKADSLCRRTGIGLKKPLGYCIWKGVNYGG